MNVIDRKKAADLLQVSVRTLDRYIRKGVLPKQDIGGRIVINFDDLQPLLSQKKIEQNFINSLNKNQPETENNVSSAEQFSPTATESATFSAVPRQNHQDSDVYKKLYEELQEELKIKQERLEGANYRVGQLEGLLKESVPLIEYRKSLSLEEDKRKELESILENFEKANDTLSQTVESKKLELEYLGKRLDQEKLNKKVFLIILVVLFLLQPLWLLFPPLS